MGTQTSVGKPCSTACVLFGLYLGPHGFRSKTHVQSYCNVAQTCNITSTSFVALTRNVTMWI